MINEIIQRFKAYDPLSIDNIEILYDANCFYETLLERLDNAERVHIACLYIGHGPKTMEIVNRLSRRAKNRLETSVMVDACRAVRSSKWMNKPNDLELDDIVQKVEVFKCSILPSTINEIFGVFHTKIYIFDNDVYLSSSNLEDHYFDSRKDRYYLIRSKEFADSMIREIFSKDPVTLEKLNFYTIMKNETQNVEIAQDEICTAPKIFSCSEYVVSLPLDVGSPPLDVVSPPEYISSAPLDISSEPLDISSEPLDAESSSEDVVSSSEDVLSEFEKNLLEMKIPTDEAAISNLEENNNPRDDLIENLLANVRLNSNEELGSEFQYKSSENSSNCTQPITKIFYFSHRDELRIIKAILEYPFEKIALTTPYLNLSKDHKALFKDRKIDIITPNSGSNTFNHPSLLGPLMRDTYAYSNYKTNMEFPEVCLYEYFKKNHTMHYKGMWFINKDMAITIVGSSNYNSRSVKLDHESNWAIVTSDPENIIKFEDEIERLKTNAPFLTVDQMGERERLFFPKMMRFFLRYYL